MNFVFKCPHCGMRKPCQDYDLGKKYNCSECLREVVITFPQDDVPQPAIQLDTEDAGKNYLSPHTSNWDEKYKDIGNEPQNGKAANIREPLTIPKEFWKYAVFIYLALIIISYIIAWNTGIDAFYIAPIVLSLIFVCPVLLLGLIAFSPVIFGVVSGIIVLLILMKASLTDILLINLISRIDKKR